MARLSSALAAGVIVILCILTFIYNFGFFVSRPLDKFGSFSSVLRSSSPKTASNVSLGDVDGDSQTFQSLGNSSSNISIPQSEHVKKSKCSVDVDYILERSPSLLSYSDPEYFQKCTEKVVSGENVLLTQLLEFAKRWDETHEKHYFCDLIQGPKPGGYDKWPEVDYTFTRADDFNWTDYKDLRGTRVFHFQNGKTFCKLFDLEGFQKYCKFRLIVLGPFGDGDNFGPFSGGPHAPYFKFKPHEEVMHMLCRVKWETVLQFLEDEKILAWISFQQTIEHPKLLSITIGTSPEFIHYGVSNENLLESLQTKKEKLIAVTFGQGYADRQTWLDAVEKSKHFLKDNIEYSKVNPFHNRTKNKRLSNEEKSRLWHLALEVPRKSKVVISPGGLGVGELL